MNQLFKNFLDSKAAVNNVYTKGACSSLKTLFEDHIAVKKGLKPDPALDQPVPVKVRKIRPELKCPERKDDVKKEHIFVDKVIFKKFLGKFEDEESREKARSKFGIFKWTIHSL